MESELARAIRQTAEQLGISPLDMATAMSYETAGTFDPWKRGPTTKWGEHRGLIQWGEPQRRKYGVFEGMPVADQVAAAGRYLTDAGVRPGMGLLDVYSAINAGGVGLYNRSDAAAGGAPGTVRDKVETQMAGHRRNAERLLGGSYPPQAPGTPAPAMGPPRDVADRVVAPLREPAPAMASAAPAGEGARSPFGDILSALGSAAGAVQPMAQAMPEPMGDGGAGAQQVAGAAAASQQALKGLLPQLRPNVDLLMSLGKRPGAGLAGLG